MPGKTTLEKFHKERDKILDQFWTDNLDANKIRLIMEQWMDQLFHHIMSEINGGKNSNPKRKRESDIRKTKNDNKELKEDKFAKVVNTYHNSEYTRENWQRNECKDCEHDDNSWHTKSKWPKQGLHLVIHHMGNKEKTSYRNGFTIVRDPRFLISKEEHWPLRVELEPTYDRIRKTKNYYVKKNEFGRREFYPLLYKRMEEAGLILDNYQQILDANRDGLWKKHPMRVQKENGKIVSTPLRFNLDKNQWKKVIETK